MMNENTKTKIAEKLQVYCGRFGSQNKAANSLKGVSSATISQIINHNWELVSNEMWLNVGTQIGYSDKEWIAVETRDFKMLNSILNDAQENSLVFAITGEAGTGKTFALKQYTENNRQVYMVKCAEFWNRKMFMMELLTVLGRDYSGYTVGEMMNEVVRAIKTQSNPLIIMDEADKLNDQLMYFFITLCNMLEDCCSIVMIATDHLEKRVRRGLMLNKKGYKEIYSRIGRKFIELKGTSSSDIMAICMANGITDKGQIKDIIEDCENDLRRVKRKIHAFKKAA